MKPLPHHYEVNLTGGPSGYAELSAAGSQVSGRRHQCKTPALSSDGRFDYPRALSSAIMTVNPAMKPSVATSSVPDANGLRE